MKTTTAQALTAVATLAAVTVLAVVHAWMALGLALAFGVITVAALGGAEDRHRREQKADQEIAEMLRKADER